MFDFSEDQLEMKNPQDNPIADDLSTRIDSISLSKEDQKEREISMSA
jgi:hypothetical protein